MSARPPPLLGFALGAAAGSAMVADMLIFQHLVGLPSVPAALAAAIMGGAEVGTRAALQGALLAILLALAGLGGRIYAARPGRGAGAAVVAVAAVALGGLALLGALASGQAGSTALLAAAAAAFGGITYAGVLIGLTALAHTLAVGGSGGVAVRALALALIALIVGGWCLRPA